MRDAVVVKGLAVACAGMQRLSGKAIPVISSGLAPKPPPAVARNSSR